MAAVCNMSSESYLSSILDRNGTRSSLSTDEKRRHPFTERLLAAGHACLDWWEGLEEPQRTGALHRFESCNAFSSIISFVILLNSIFVCFMANWEMQNLGVPEPVEFMMFEWAFLCFFAAELTLRMIVHRLYFFVNSDMKWNIFDLVLVCISAVDALMELSAAGDAGQGDGSVSYMRIMRLFKLAKILRALRVMKVFRALATILDSFVRCAISLFWSLLMLVFMLYVFSLIFMQGITGHLTDAGLEVDTIEEYRIYFGTVPQSMLTLYMAVTGGDDWSLYYHKVERTGEFYGCSFLAFTFLFAFAVFSILTGIFVEKAVEAAKPDMQEEVVQKRKAMIREASELKRLCRLLDEDNSGTLTLEKFKECMKNPTLVAYMATVGLDVHDVDVFYTAVVGGNVEIDQDSFVERCMALKGQAKGVQVQQQLLETRRLVEAVSRLERAL